MKKLLILIPLFVSGCTASRVYTSGSSNYAPVNEKRGGTVKYIIRPRKSLPNDVQRMFGEVHYHQRIRLQSFRNFSGTHFKCLGKPKHCLAIHRLSMRRKLKRGGLMDLTREMQIEAAKAMTLERIMRELIKALIETGTDPKEAIRLVVKGGKL